MQNRKYKGRKQVQAREEIKGKKSREEQNKAENTKKKCGGRK